MGYIGPGTPGRSRATLRCSCSLRRSSPVFTGWRSAFIFPAGVQPRPLRSRPPSGALNWIAWGSQKVDVDAGSQGPHGAALVAGLDGGLVPRDCGRFLLRSFLFEPFKIPSGSMIPTLLVGDLILVNKFTYGIRLPVINTRLTEGTRPVRGDVLVFRYPPQPSMDYIKRVVGVPGDEVAYINKRLTINGKAVDTKALARLSLKKTRCGTQTVEEQLGDQAAPGC